MNEFEIHHVYGGDYCLSRAAVETWKVALRILGDSTIKGRLRTGNHKPEAERRNSACASSRRERRGSMPTGRAGNART